MGETDLWFGFLGSGAGLSSRRITEELAAAGVTGRAVERHSFPAAGPGLVLLDRVDPEACARVREASRRGEERLLAILTGDGPDAAGGSWRLLAAGASDVFAWHRVAHPARLVAARLRRWREIDDLVRTPEVAGSLVGRSLALRAVVRQLVEVARFTRAPVLVTGESGTGKELAARLIHRLDPRPDKGELVVVDSSTVVPELSGSEFFGHERGAFTHAVASREGAFAVADRGTLFLDEVGELPLRLQAELLRAVQEKSHKRVGSNLWRRSDFRLVCATNRDLEAAMARGEFRSDLYHRIAAWRCHLPPLADRREDVPELVRHFLTQAFPKEPPEIEPLLLDILAARDYPGNVRELRQLVERIAGRNAGGGAITLGDLPEEERPPPGAEELDWRDDGFRRALEVAVARRIGLKEIGNAAAEAAVEIAVAGEGGNLQRAAEKLGVTDRALQMRRAKRRGAPGDAPA